MKKNIFIDGVHDYDLVDDNNGTYTLYHSEGTQWNEEYRGVTILIVKDDGNGFKIISKGLDLNDTNVEYDDMLHLDIITRYINRDRVIEIAERTKL